MKWEYWPGHPCGKNSLGAPVRGTVHFAIRQDDTLRLSSVTEIPGDVVAATLVFGANTPSAVRYRLPRRANQLTTSEQPAKPKAVGINPKAMVHDPSIPRSTPSGPPSKVTSRLARLRLRPQNPKTER